MSVEAFTVDGKVTIDTTPFESGIAKVTTQLSELSGSMKSMMEMGGGNWNFNGALNGLKTLKDDIAVIKQDIATMNTEFANTQGINALKTEIASLRSEMDAIKEKINQMGSVAQENVTKVGSAIESAKQKTLGWSEQIAKVTEGIVSLMSKEEFSNYILEQQESEVGQINAQWREMQGLIQSNTTFMREIEASGSNIARYFTHETQILERNVALLEQEAELTSMLNQRSRQNATTVSNIAKELNRVANFSREVGTYFANEDKILRMSLRTLQEQDRILADKLAKSERETALAREIAEINKLDMDIRRASANAEAEMLAFLESESGIISSITGSREKGLSVINEELTLEKEKMALIEEETALINEQNAVKQKGAVTGANGGKNKLDKMGYLPSRIGSMALTMWGFNEIMDIYETTSANLNARGSMKYFGDQLMKDERYLTQTNQTLGDVRRGLQGFGTDLDALQKKYQKIDMKVIGANAEETAYKYGVSTESLGELAEAYAIYGSEFVKQGRSQEDSVLAINDALDGEVRRLKEVNIGMDDLVAHGYDGSTETMIKALNEIAKERGYDVTAQNITNLSDAITVLELKISQGLASAFEYIEPLLREVAMDFIYMIDAITWAFGELNKLWLDFSTELDKTFGVRNVQKFGSSVVRVLGAVITLAITFGIVYKVVKGLKGMIKDLFGMLGKGTDDIAKTTGDVAKTGGTVGKDSGGGFRDNFMKQWSKTGKDIGKMARVFADVVVGMAMAFVVIEEAILIISGIGYTYEALKPQFESGIEFIKEFGIWFALLGGAMLVLSYALDKVPESAMQGITKGATKLALGMAIAIGLVTEAIGLLIAPMLAIALLGGTASFLGTNLDKGLEVISWIGNALHQIDLPVALFIGGFLAISLLLGLVQPLTLALAVGIASALLLVTEAIVMLIPPLGAIALLGGTASMLGEDNIQQGADALKIVGQALKTIAEAVPYLLAVDIGVLGQELMDWGSKLITGKDGLTYLSEDIIPNLDEFVDSFNTATIDPIDTTTVANLTQVANQLPTIKSAIDKIRTSVGNGGTGGINVFGFQIGGDTSSLKPKLDSLYNNIKDVMDFANKLGNLSTSTTGGATTISSVATAIAQLQAKLRLISTVINTASTQVRASAKNLGSGITQGFKEGSASFNSTVVSTLAKGISAVQSRYATWLSGGKASAQKLADGFKTIGGKLKSSVREEMGYALNELDNYKDDFYNKGAMLGQSLVDGFKSKKALDQNSPAKITKSIREELGYSMEALNTGKQMMYQGGVALGQALTNGYNSYGNLRTDVGVLASKGVSNEQLQANAKNTQLNGNLKGQTPQLTQTNINIDMSNSTVIGVQDLDNKIRQAVEKAIVSMNSPNGAIGY